MLKTTPPGSPKSQSAAPKLHVKAPETPPSLPQWMSPELENSPPESLKSALAASKPVPDPFTGDSGERTPTDFMKKVIQSRKVTDPEDDALIAELMAETSPDTSEESPPDIGYGKLAPPITEEEKRVDSTPGGPSVEEALNSMQLPLRKDQSVFVTGTGSPIRIKGKEKSLSPLSEESEISSESLSKSQSSVPETAIRRATSTKSTSARAPLSRTATGLASSAIVGGPRLREELRSRKSYQSGNPTAQSQNLKFDPSVKGKEPKRRPGGLERRLTESQALRERISSLVTTASSEPEPPAPEPKSVSPGRPAPPSRASSIFSAFNPLSWVLSRPATESQHSSQEEWALSKEGQSAEAAGGSGHDDSKGKEPETESMEETKEPVGHRDWRKKLLRQQRAGRGDLSVVTAPRPGTPALLSTGLKSSDFPTTPRASAGEFLAEMQERIKRGIEHLQGENETFTFDNLLDAMKLTAATDYPDTGGEPFGDNAAITKETLDRVLADIDSGTANLDLNTRQHNRELRDQLELAGEDLAATLQLVDTKEIQIRELEQVVEDLEAERDRLNESLRKLGQSLKDNQVLLRQYSKRGKVDESSRFKQLQDDYDHLNEELEHSEEERARLQGHIDQLEKDLASWTETAQIWEQFPGGVPDGAALALKDRELKRLASEVEKLAQENIQIKAKLAAAGVSSAAAVVASSEGEYSKDNSVKGQPAEDQPQDDQPQDDQPQDDQPQDDQPQDDQPQDDQPQDDQPQDDDQSQDDRPQDDQPQADQSGDESDSSDDDSSDNHSSDDEPEEDDPAKDKPAEDERAEDEPAEDEPAKSQSVKNKSPKSQSAKAQSSKDQELKSMAAAFDSLSKEYVRVRDELDEAKRSASASQAADAKDKKPESSSGESSKLPETTKPVKVDATTASKDKDMKRLAAQNVKLMHLYKEAKAQLAKRDGEMAEKGEKVDRSTGESSKLPEESKQGAVKPAKKDATKDTDVKRLAAQNHKLMQLYKEAKAHIAEGDAETAEKDKEVEAIAVETEALVQELKTTKAQLARLKGLEGSMKDLLLEADDQISGLQAALKAGSSVSGGQKAAGKSSKDPKLPGASPSKRSPRRLSGKGIAGPGGHQDPPFDPETVYHEPCTNCVPIYLYHPDSYLRTTFLQSSEVKDSLRPSDNTTLPWEPCCEHVDLATKYCGCQGKCPAHPCCEHWCPGGNCECLESCPAHDCCGHYDREERECGCDETCDLHDCCEHYHKGSCHCEEVGGSYHDVRDLKSCPTWTHGYCSCNGNCYDHGACKHWDSDKALYSCQEPCDLRDLTGDCEHPVNQETGEASCEKLCDAHPCCRHYSASERLPTCMCGGRCREHRCCEHWKKNTRLCTCAETCQAHRPEDFPPPQPKAAPSESTGAYAKRRTSHFVSQTVPRTLKQSPIETSKTRKGNEKQALEPVPEAEKQPANEPQFGSLPRSFRRPTLDPPGGPSWTRNRGPPPIIGYVCLNHRVLPVPVTQTRREIFLSEHPSYMGQLLGNIFQDPPDTIWQLLLCILFIPIWWVYNFRRLSRGEVAQPLPKTLPKDAFVSVSRVLTLVYLICLFIALKEERRIWLRANGATAAYMRDLRQRPPYPWWSPVEADPRLLEPLLGQVTDTVHRYFFPRPSATV